MEAITYIRKKQKSKFDLNIFYLCVIDILFIPYFPLIATNFSLILVYFWYIKRVRIIKSDKEHIIFLVVVIFMMLSILISYIFPQYTVASDILYQNVKKFIQYTSYFLYYFLFKFCFKRYDLKIKPFLITFICFGALLAIIYFLDTSSFASIRGFWNDYDILTKYYNDFGTSNFTYRYNFIWSDPNNPAYAFVAVVIFLLNNEKINLSTRFLMLISLIVLLVGSMSSGGIISFIIAFLVVMIHKFLIAFGKKNAIISVKRSNALLFMIICILFLVAIIQIGNITQIDLVSTSLKRLESNTGGGRLQIWQYLINEENMLKYVFWGQGSTIYVNGNSYLPHNGALYLIYGYGMVVAFAYMYLLFAKRKGMSWGDYYFVIPVIIGFTINTIIGEQKFMVLYVLLMAAASSKRYMQNAKYN